MTYITPPTGEGKPAINADELVRAWGSSPVHLKRLLNRYRRYFTDREIVAAMAQSAELADAIGRRR
jgi:hypothetical protein